MELKEMNEDKVGEPFHYPTTFFYLDMLKHTFIFHTDRLRVLHKGMLKEEYLLFQTTLQ
jgi:hypothetical protein